MPVFRSSHPYRQIAIPFADKLCGASLCGLFAIFKRAQTGWWRSDGIPKIFSLTAHTSDLLFIVVDDSTRNRAGFCAIIAQNAAPDLMANWHRITAFKHGKPNPFDNEGFCVRRFSGGCPPAMPMNFPRASARIGSGMAGFCPAVYPLKCPGSIRSTAGKLPGSVLSIARQRP
jgi:hypothetical protein